MQYVFERISNEVTGLLRGDEMAACHFSGEESDFVRFNRNAIRQAGSVCQMKLLLDLISGSRHAQIKTTLSGEWREDRVRLKRSILKLRDMLPMLTEDPHLVTSTGSNSDEQIGKNELPSSEDVMEEILKNGQGLDLVGIYTSGGMYAGFSNSLGQKNWSASYSFHLDWSLYCQGNKAVKSRYAGAHWDSKQFDRISENAKNQSVALSNPPISISRGNYRVYLAPPAVAEFVEMVAMRGFGIRARRTKQSSLLEMAEERRRIHPTVHISENTREGTSPNFQQQGFLKPPIVPLVDSGALADCLVSPRSEREWGVPHNGAADREAPESLDMKGGELSTSQVLEKLEKGIYLGDLWYLNYSDLPSCRITGLTRFASFWVENGEIKAPIEVMRFDETIYRVLGENLLGLTRERELFPDSNTYGERSTRSCRVPGALVEGFNLTL